METDIFVSNVKISCKAQLFNTNNISFNRDIDIKQYNNFNVIKNKYTFIIFTKSKIKQKFHVNITKIPSFDHIPKAIEELKNIIENSFSVKDIKIENITCLHILNMEINLIKIFKNITFSKFSKDIVNTRYNPEKFPGMFIKLKKCSILLFSSGKIVIIGATSEEEAKNGIILIVNMVKQVIIVSLKIL